MPACHIPSSPLHAALLAMLLAGCTGERLGVAELAPDSLRLGLVAHWTCDEGAGDTLVDHSGNGHDGAIIGATWTDGRFASALHFEAGNSVTVPSFPQATSGWSVSLWNRSPPGDQGTDFLTLVSTEIPFVGGWEWNVRLSPDDTKYHFGYPRGGDAGIEYNYDDCKCVETARWTHMVGVVDGDDLHLSIYKNGTLQVETPVSDRIQPGNTDLFIGRWTLEDRFLVGDVDDIAIYNRALAPVEIQSLYAQPAPDPL
jgi:hypothetical protein